MKIYIPLILLLQLFAITSIAQDKTNEAIATDRPDQTESALIIPAKTLQIETGFVLENDDKTKNFAYNTTLIRIGINEYFEFRVISEYLGLKNDDLDVHLSGFGPLALGAKFQLAKADGWVPDVSFIGHINLRTGADDFKPDYVAPDFRVSIEYDLSDRFSVGFNLGAEWNGTTPNATGIYTLVLGSGITDKLGCFIEVYGFIEEQTDTYDHRWNGGFTYLLTDLAQLDISGGYGLSKVSPDNFISAGLSFRVPN